MRPPAALAIPKIYRTHEYAKADYGRGDCQQTESSNPAKIPAVVFKLAPTAGAG